MFLCQLFHVPINLGTVHDVKQLWKKRTQIKATTTPMANIKNTAHLFIKVGLIVKSGVFKGDRPCHF